MPFSFGGSKSDSQSSGQSTAFDVAQSGSVSGGFSEGGSESSQRVAFEDIFARLFGGAEGAAAGLDPSMLTQTANQLFSGGMSFLDSLSGGADSDFIASRLSGESPILGEQISALGEDIGSFFTDQILPGITSEAVGGGTLGGGRQGVAEGAAANAATREFQRGATALRAGDIAARDRLAAVAGDQRIGAATAGLGGLGALAGIADFGFSANLAPFERLAGILGGPTVLGDSSSFSTAEDFARALSQSFGSSQSTQQSTSESTAFRLG